MATLTERINEIAAKSNAFAVLAGTTIKGIQSTLASVQAAALNAVQVDARIQTALAAFVGTAPEALNTWIELIQAIESNTSADASALTGLTTLIGTKASAESVSNLTTTVLELSDDADTRLDALETGVGDTSVLVVVPDFSANFLAALA